MKRHRNRRPQSTNPDASSKRPIARTLAFTTPAACLAILTAAPAVAGPGGWATASGVGRDVLVAAALGAPAVEGDWRGLLDGGLSVGAGGVGALAFKELVHERRPDGSDRRSFPSGHAAVSFAAAASLEKRYGWQVGLPATLLAAFVGVARVEGRKHYWHDVLAGAAIGEASGLLLTPRGRAVALVPWGDAHGAGLTLAGRF